MRCNAHEGVYEQGKEAGIKIGEINGKKIGEIHGKKIRNLEIAKKMLLKGTRLEDIAELTDLSLSEVENLSNELK